MNHRPTPIHLALALLFGAAVPCAGAAATAFEVPSGGPPLQLAQTEIERHVFINETGDGVLFAAAEAAADRVVKGAPYCAEAVNETVQWLPDGSGGVGNRIVQQRSSRTCRDGEGRTRQEVNHDGRQLVYLRDPVARENWVLDVQRRTARRLGSGVAFTADGGLEGAAWRDYGERMREWARSIARPGRESPAAGAAVPGAAPVPPAPPAPPVPPVPPVPVVIDVEPGQAVATARVLRLRPPDGAASQAVPAMAPPAVMWRARTLGGRGAGVASPLGTRDIEGLRVNGERTVWTIEAGRLGNERPIQITREVWTSPELMLTVRSRDFDPRVGEVSFRLQDVKRGEPDAALFQVPADYSAPAKTKGGRTGAAG